MSRYPGTCFAHGTKLTEAHGRKGPYYFCQTCRDAAKAHREGVDRALDEIDRRAREVVTERDVKISSALKAANIDPYDFVEWLRGQL